MGHRETFGELEFRLSVYRTVIETSNSRCYTASQNSKIKNYYKYSASRDAQYYLWSYYVEANFRYLLTNLFITHCVLRLKLIIWF